MTIRIEPLLSDDEIAAEMDQWLRLFANRNEVADIYAEYLAQFGVSWNGWKDINEAILRRWSMAGLRYIKTRAWKLVAEKKGIG